MSLEQHHDLASSSEITPPTEDAKAPEEQSALEWFKKAPKSIRGGIATVALLGVFGAGYALAGSERGETAAVAPEGNETEPAEEEVNNTVAPVDEHPEETQEPEQAEELSTEELVATWTDQWNTEKGIVNREPSAEGHIQRFINENHFQLTNRIRATAEAESDIARERTSEIYFARGIHFLVERDNQTIVVSNPIVYGIRASDESTIARSWQVGRTDHAYTNFVLFYQDRGEIQQFTSSDSNDIRWASDRGAVVSGVLYEEDWGITLGEMDQDSLNDNRPDRMILITEEGYTEITDSAEAVYDSTEDALLDLIDQGLEPGPLTDLNRRLAIY